MTEQDQPEPQQPELEPTELDLSTLSRIGTLAKETGLKTSTLRYYEKVGLIKPEAYSDAGYRLYSDLTMRTLCFIQNAKSFGFSLEDIRTILSISGEHSCSTRIVRIKIEKKIKDIQHQIKELTEICETLYSLKCLCKGTTTIGCCPIMSSLYDKKQA